MVRNAALTLIVATICFASQADGADVLLLDFWSPQCGPCMQMKPTIQAFKAKGWPIREVDVTRENELARQHRVDRIPCLVMLVDGQEVDRIVGFTSSDRIQQLYRQAHEAVRRIADQRRGQSPDPAPPPAQASAPADNAAILEKQAKLLASTVRLRVDDGKLTSYGTGTIIDARDGQALVITCGHLFRETQGKGPVVVEVFDTIAGRAQPAGEVRAQVISYDLNREVALVGIWPERPVSVARVALRGSKIERGDRVLSVGCSNGQDPTAVASHVTALDRYQGPPNIEASGAPVEGRSGGGLFNSQGELIGVCFAADPEANEGLYAALESIHDELTARGLGDLVGGVAENSPNSTGRGNPATTDAPIVRGQEPLTPVLPVPQARPATLPSRTAAASVTENQEVTSPTDLSTVEQATWEEIMTRASKAEVICIIRPKEPGGQSEVIALDNVSSDFVRALAARRKGADEAALRR